MIIHSTTPKIEGSELEGEKLFSIADEGFVMDLLRSKLYSNPQYAVAREISCNARDAHREAGISNIPIQIHLPNTLEPYYKIKDWGLGISPDRMADVFIKFGASTKRNDNIQTGGFGIGSGAIFSTCDSYSIIVNYNNIKRNYACFIDETKMGKLAILSESPTTDPNGTEIIIPVKKEDFHLFTEWTHHSTKHWDVKPIIKGGTIHYSPMEIVLSGNQWVIEKNNDWQNNLRLIIDGIEYPVALDALRKYAKTTLLANTKGNIYLYFNNGEISLSASREQVYLDEITTKKIAQRLDEMLEEIVANVNKKIDLFTNLWEANIFYKKDLSLAFRDFSFLGQLSWKNRLLSGSSFYVECDVQTFTKSYNRYGYKKSTDKIKKSLKTSIFFDEQSLLFVNDLGIKDVSLRNVKKSFEDNGNITSVQVICPSDTMPIEDINKKYHFDEMAPRLLSSITKYTKPRKKSSERLILFKYNSNFGRLAQISYEDMESDTNKKILCRFEKDFNNNRKISYEENPLNDNIISKLLQKFPNYSLYGIDKSINQEKIDDETFDHFISIKDFIDVDVLTSSVNFLELKIADLHGNNIDSYEIKAIDTFRKDIIDSNSLYLQKLELQLKLTNLIYSKDNIILNIYELIKGKITDEQVDSYMNDYPQWNIKEIIEKCRQKYSLLQHLNRYTLSRNATPIIEYINLIDKG